METTPCKWDLRFLDLATMIASWSKDPSTKVGCVIVRPDLTVAGLGFNGFPRGMCDHEDLLADREIKYSRTLHAEENAILNTFEKLEGYTAYVTAPPCCHCALHLIQSGITRVVAREPTRELLERWGKQLAQTKGFFQEVEIDYLEL